MTNTLITGANKGLGRAAARRLIELGHTVYLGCRDAERGQRAAAELGGEPLLIEVTSDASVAAAAAQIRDRAGQLDVLVNNAGVPGGFRPAAVTTAADMLAVYDTNVFGVATIKPDGPTGTFSDANEPSRGELPSASLRTARSRRAWCRALGVIGRPAARPGRSGGRRRARRPRLSRY
jgi:NAD(P)-dependent dehydrogenase (short-subunit alcohol dehydrogenase family)